MTVKNPGDEFSLDEIFDSIRELLETKKYKVKGMGLDIWYGYLETRIQQRLGRTKVG